MATVPTRANVGCERCEKRNVRSEVRALLPANIVGTVLVCVGSEDPYVTAADRAAFESEMRAAGVDWRMHVYGGVEHSFTHPYVDDAGIPGLRYHPPTATRSWQEMLQLFDEVF